VGDRGAGGCIPGQVAHPVTAVSIRTRWYVTLSRRGENSFQVTVREDPKQRGASPATLQDAFEGIENVRRFLQILPPHRMVELEISVSSGEPSYKELDAPPGETVEVRRWKVEEALTGIRSAARYAAVGLDWGAMADLFGRWRQEHEGA
jgi:hypothetical protein